MVRRRALVPTGALVALALALPGVPPAAAAPGTDRLVEGEELRVDRPGDVLRSPSGQHELFWGGGEGFTFVIQLFGSTPVTFLPGGDVGDEPTRLVLQDDGNLVIYDVAGRPLWFTGTSSAEPTRLVLQDDGNLVLYTDSGRVLWASHGVPDQMLAYTFSEATGVGPTSLRPGHVLLSADRRYRLVLQSDGNLVQYDAAGRPLFATMTFGGADSEFVAQTDGNLVVYDGGRPVWQSGTAERLPETSLVAFQLVLQTDGNLVQYRGAPTDTSYELRPTWASRQGRVR